MALVVTCHMAQKMPRLEAEREGGYDRIICDVPCTGDGTTRKHPEVFARWEVALACVSTLQLQIAMRGAALLRVGGLMCYSTCSLNPIENESVVAELLRRCGGALELVDGADKSAEVLTGGSAPGMVDWRVYDFGLVAHQSHAALQASDSVTAAQKRLYVPSMWPPTTPNPQLKKCVRLLPHRSESGGFFVALLRKVAPLPTTPSPAWPRAPAAVNSRASTAGPVAAMPHGGAAPIDPSGQFGGSARYAPISEEVAAGLSAVLAERSRDDRRRHKALQSPIQRLFARSANATRIVRMTHAAEHCCTSPRLNVIHAGATVFRRTQATIGSASGRRQGSTCHCGRKAAPRYPCGLAHCSFFLQLYIRLRYVGLGCVCNVLPQAA